MGTSDQWRGVDGRCRSSWPASWCWSTWAASPHKFRFDGLPSDKGPYDRASAGAAEWERRCWDEWKDPTLEEAFTPPEGVYNSVFAAASFRNDGQLELLSSYFRVRRRARLRERFERSLEKWLIDPNAASKVSAEIESRIATELSAEKEAWGTRLQEAIVAVPRKHVKESDGGVEKALKLVRNWIAERFQVSREDSRPQDERYFTTATFELGGKAPLSWYLSRKDSDTIENAVKGDARGADNVTKTIQDLSTWRENREKAAQE